MKLKRLREHYVSSDSGATWRAKKSFKSPDEIQDAGFYRNKWRSYICGTCGDWHITSRDKLDDNDG